MMSAEADGFIGIPGGFGTLEELMEMVTWQQLGLHTKPVGILNIAGYYDHLLDFFDHAVEEVWPQKHLLLEDQSVSNALQRAIPATSVLVPPSVDSLHVTVIAQGHVVAPVLFFQHHRKHHASSFGSLWKGGPSWQRVV